MNVDMTQFKTLKELQEFAESQHRTILTLELTLKEQREKVIHLEKLLTNIPSNTFVVDDKEIEICKIEINRLYNKSIREPLEDKEIRNLEVLVKTLAVAKGKTVSDVKDKKEKAELKNIPTAKLLELAKTVRDV